MWRNPKFFQACFASTARAMAKIVMAEKKPNGAYRFKEKVVEAGDVQDVLREARS